MTEIRPYTKSEIIEGGRSGSSKSGEAETTRATHSRVGPVIPGLKADILGGVNNRLYAITGFRPSEEGIGGVHNTWFYSAENKGSAVSLAQRDGILIHEISPRGKTTLESGRYTLGQIEEAKNNP